MMKSKSILPMPFFRISRKEIFFRFFLRRWKPAVAFVVFEGLKQKRYTLLFLALDSKLHFSFTSMEITGGHLRFFYMKIRVLLNPIVFFLSKKITMMCLIPVLCTTVVLLYWRAKSFPCSFLVEDPVSFSNEIFLLKYRRWRRWEVTLRWVSEGAFLSEKKCSSLIFVKPFTNFFIDDCCGRNRNPFILQIWERCNGDHDESCNDEKFLFFEFWDLKNKRLSDPSIFFSSELRVRNLAFIFFSGESQTDADLLCQNDVMVL